MKKLLSLLIMSLLAGCAAAPIPVPVIQTNTVVIQTPQSLLQPCNISAPPTRTEYMAADMQGRENYLTNYINSLLKDFGICNKQIAKIASFQSEQTQLYNKKVGQ